MNDDKIRRIWTDAELENALAALHADVRTDERVLATARTALLERADEAANAVMEVAGSRRPRRRVRHWVAASAVVGVLASGGVLAQTITFGGGPPPATAEAAELLERAATQTIGAVDEPAAGQYRYVETHAWWMRTAIEHGRQEFTWLAEHVHRTWVPEKETDEWLHRREETGKRSWVVGTEQDARAAGIPLVDPMAEGEWRAPCGDWFAEQEGRKPCSQGAGWHNPTPEWQASLPKDPDALYERLREDAPENSRGDTELLVYAADALRTGLLTKDVRAALYQALAELPGLDVTDRSANLDGRVGIALGMDDGTMREEIIIDPETGQFIGERTVTTKGNGAIKSGTVISHTSVITDVVAEMGEQPAN